MLIEKKDIVRLKKVNKPSENLKENKISAPDTTKSNLVVGEKYLIKDIHEVETNFLLNVGLGISYAVVLSFLIIKLLA